MGESGKWALFEPRRAAVLAEIHRLERMIVRVWQILSLAGVLTGVVYAASVARALGLGCAAASAAFLVWFVALGYFLDRGRAPRALLWVNVVIEGLVPWAFTLVIVGTKGASYALGSWVPPFLYCSCIIAHVARLRPLYPLLFGLVGALLYPLLYFFFIEDRLTPEARQLLINQPATQLTRSVTLAATGLIAMLLVVGFRHVLEAAQGSPSLRVTRARSGRVFEAIRCPEGGSERRVLLELLSSERTAHPEVVTAHRRAVELASGLSHPAILQVLELVRHDGDWVVVSEHVAGISLRELLDALAARNAVVSPALSAHVARGLLAALDYVHEGARDENGRPLALAHRDLSPEHVQLCHNGDVKLAGFALPEALRNFQRMSDAHRAYAAPEQATGPGDARSDVYSAGLVLQELFTGRAPPALDLAALGAQRPDAPRFAELLAHALEPDPHARSSARALLRLLDAMALDEELGRVELGELARALSL